MKINFQTINNIWQIRQAQNRRQNSFATNLFAQNNYDTLEISFKASNHCTTQNFKVKNIPNLHCPACGLIMLTDEQIALFVRDVSSKRGQNLKDALEKYEDESAITGKPARNKEGFGIYRPIKKQIIDIYKQLALENPDMDLLALTKLQAKRCIDDLIKEQMAIIEELSSFVEKNYEGDKKDVLLKKIDEYKKQINGESKEQFARKKFIYAMRQAVDKEHRDDVEKITNKMPTSENDINSFFVKYAKKNDLTSNDIASKFVNQSTPTAEHVKPRALGGRDSLNNYICDCAECNSRRGHIPFYEWLQTLDGFELRLQDYVEDVRKAIDADFFKDFPEYDTYVEKIIETLAEITEGEVILEIPEVTNPVKNAAILKRRETELERIKTQNARLAQKRDELKEEIAKLEEYPDFDDAEEYGEILAEIASVNVEIEGLSQKIYEYRKPIYDFKKELEALEGQIESAKTTDQKEALKKQYAERNAQFKVLEGQVSTLEKRMGTLKRRRINLRKQKKVFFAKENDLKERIEKLRKIINKLDDLFLKVGKLGNWEQKEANLSEKIAQLQAQIESAQAQNEQITSNPEFNTSNSSTYNEYSHQKELLKAANDMLTKQDYKKTAIKAGYGREIIEIAKSAIQKEIDRLEANDSVIYYSNLINIKNWQTKKEEFEAKLAEIYKTKREAKELKAQIEQICEGKSDVQLRREYEDLISEKRTIEEITKIGQKRARSEHLTKLVRKNNAQLKKLEDYKNLTNAQYAELLSFIELDETV